MNIHFICRESFIQLFLLIAVYYVCAEPLFPSWGLKLGQYSCSLFYVVIPGRDSQRDIYVSMSTWIAAGINQAQGK